MIEIYRSGLTLDQVAHRFGMTAMPMRHRLVAGVTMRPRGKAPRQQSAGMGGDR